MNKRDLEHFKTKLLEEKKDLETELGEVAQKNPSLAQGWEATSGNMDVDPADENEVADKFEEYEGNKGVMEKLEKQLNEVNSALERINNGNYGICEVCKEPIEKERLEANPSSKISIKHKH
ncbi:MAG: TraR/DksA C4-type zinc finger protein [Candidatus Paceibacterota bacterium]|jgi:RNA polymerase-binding protein DksA